MKSICDTFKTAFDTLIARNWNHIYVLVDVHGVMMEPNYGSISTDIYPDCVDPLQILSTDPKIKLIMWTCSNHNHVELYRTVFKALDIHFDYVNENPEVSHKDSSGDYTVKLYANVIMDDKAGFDPHVDWNLLHQYLRSPAYTNIVAPSASTPIIHTLKQ